MTDAFVVTEKKKRFRSPPYPMFDLAKAIERASAVMEHAHHHQVGTQVLSEAWGMKSSGGKVWRSVAALIQYGLLTASGSGKSRKFKLSDMARRIVQDTNPFSQKRKGALIAVALSPMIHKELWEKFKTAKGLSESVLKTHLTLDRVEEGEAPYSSSAADEVIETYLATLAFAGISDSDTLPTDEEDKNGDKLESHVLLEETKAKINDFVKWTLDGVAQFESRKVEWVSDDGTFLRVFGSPTGIPMADIAIVNEPGKNPTTTPAKQEQTGGDAETPPAGHVPPNKMESNITVYQVGGRLQITADVDAKGIKKLRDVLDKYEEILNLLN